MPGPGLPEDIASTYPDVGLGAAEHQGHHDGAHGVVNRFDKDDVPTDGDRWEWDAGAGVYRPSVNTAAKVTIADAGGFFEGTNVEAVLAEIGLAWPYFSVKSSDQSRNNTITLGNDDDLAFPVGVSQQWMFILMARIVVTSATMDIDHGFTVPSGTSIVAGSQGSFGSPPTALVDPVAIEVNLNIPGTSASGYPLFYRGWVTTGGTPGNVQWRWAQNVQEDNAPGLTVKAGSFLQAIRLV